MQTFHSQTLAEQNPGWMATPQLSEPVMAVDNANLILYFNTLC